MALTENERIEALAMKRSIANAQTDLAVLGTRFNIIMDQNEDNASPFQDDITMAKVRIMAARIAGIATVLATALTTE